MKDKSWLEQQRDNLEDRILAIEMEAVLGEIEVNSEDDYDKAVIAHRALMNEHKACKEALARIEKLLEQKEQPKGG